MNRMTRQEFDAIGEAICGARLAGRPNQGIYEQSAVQNFEIGASKKVKGSWTFHYCQVSVALPVMTGQYRLSGSLSTIVAANELILTVAALAGQKVVSIPDAASAVDYYRGGTIEIWSVAGTRYEFHRIASSTVSDGTDVLLTLEENLAYAIAIGEMVLPMPSIYRAVGPMGAVYARRQYAAGLSLIPVTINYYSWLLTYGPCFISCQGGGWPQDAVDCMDVFAWQDGTIAHLGAWGAGTYDGAGTSPQRVGTGLYQGDYGVGRIMLQLDP